MLIRLLYAHEMTKHVCKISHLNSKRLLRKLQKILGGYFILPHPVHRLQRLQDATARLLCSASLLVHAHPLLQRFHWLVPVVSRPQYKLCTYNAGALQALH